MGGQPIKKKKNKEADQEWKEEVNRDEVDFYTVISQLLSGDC